MRRQSPLPVFLSTSDETRNPQTVNEGIVELVATGIQLSYHVQIGPDCPCSS